MYVWNILICKYVIEADELLKRNKDYFESMRYLVNDDHDFGVHIN